MELINKQQEKKAYEVKQLPFLLLPMINRNTEFCFVTTAPVMNAETTNTLLNVKNYHYIPILSIDTIRIKIILTYTEVM